MSARPAGRPAEGPAGGPAGPDPPEGLLVVAKPAGPTSHDVVARVRRLAGTRRVGHAGTLDPAATGVLVLGLGRATRLLGRLALDYKDYQATIRIGVATTTDDAAGEVLARSDRPWTVEALRAAMADLLGPIDQVPSAVSAVKVDGVRAYARVRAGLDVDLPARPVTVHAFDLLAVRPEVHEADVRVTCSSGTYVRALARDVGRALGTGAHLVRLERTRAGRYDLARATGLSDLAAPLPVTPLAQAAEEAFPRIDVDPVLAEAVAHGRRVALPGLRGRDGDVAVFGAGELLALARRDPADGLARYPVVFAPPPAHPR